MSDTPPAAEDEIAQQVREIRASGILARSKHLDRLLEFLHRCHLDGRVPKEFEVAVEGLGRHAGFDATQDALVRVYIHKLRRKLDDYYQQDTRPDACRLILPKGEYRLQLAAPNDPPAPSPPSPSPEAAPRPWQRIANLARRHTRLLAFALLASLLLNLLLAGQAWRQATDDTPQLRTSVLWQPLFADARPVVVVLGDYYLFAETDGDDRVRRLVRDFEINSPGDLASQLQQHPSRAERQFDVGLSYLSTSTGYALNRLGALLNSGPKKAWGVILASELTPENLRNSHLIFVGHLSGLGLLEPLVFAHSGFRLGRGYDELVDKASGQHFHSASGIAHENVAANHLAYLSSFQGPTGNRIVILAGCRDAGLRELADAVASPGGLAALEEHTGGAPFEALYQTSGFGSATTPARLLLHRSLAPPAAPAEGR